MNVMVGEVCVSEALIKSGGRLSSYLKIARSPLESRRALRLKLDEELRVSEQDEVLGFLFSKFW